MYINNMLCRQPTTEYYISTLLMLVYPIYNNSTRKCLKVEAMSHVCCVYRKVRVKVNVLLFLLRKYDAKAYALLGFTQRRVCANNTLF